MHLTPHPAETVKTLAQRHFRADVALWLFGSRLDDSARVSHAMHGRQVDVVISAPTLMRLPIHDIAFQDGRLL